MRLKPGVVQQLPCSAVAFANDDYARDLTAAEILASVLQCPGVEPTGPAPGQCIWLGTEREGLMEIQSGTDLVFVGHAKLAPLLALYAVLEAARPGWFLLDLGTYTLHDPPSLRAWLTRRLALVQGLGRKT